MGAKEFSPPASGVSTSGLPEGLRTPLEALTGLDLSNVTVHYNSLGPRIGAHAYAQGAEIHLAPGQAHTLGHEACHVVQQRQGRVQPISDLGETQRAYVRGNALAQK
jgi:hypothetical protein